MPFVTYPQVSSTPLDYIIVGGGTAGLVLATRLTEDPEVHVLVIEAGASHGHIPDIDIPGNIGRTIGNPIFDWLFVSVPQKRAKDRVVIQPRGKGLGGSSFMNYTNIIRPSKDEIDALEELGNEGWNWDSLLYYMKKSETLHGSELSAADTQKYALQPDLTLHGGNGPIHKSPPTIWTEMHARIFDTAEKLGVPRNLESGNGVNDGCVTSLLSVDSTTGTRSYTVNAYLEPNLHRPNLLVLTEAQVTKVILEKVGSLQKAIGVELVQDGESLKLDKVKRDIVICAGSLQTPHVLELSGIGNSNLLSKYGIQTLVDLPSVGENLQDHMGITTIVEVETEDETMDTLRDDPVVLEKHRRLYQENRAGILATVPVPGFIFLSADFLGNRKEIQSWKELARVRCTDSVANSVPSLSSGLKKQYEILQRMLDSERHVHAELIYYNGHQPNPNSIPEQGKRYCTINCLLTHPFSRGSVHIASDDPLAPPAIDPNYFANEADLDLAIHMVEAALKLYKTEPLSSAVKGLKMPPAETLAQGRKGLEDYVKENCRPVYHPVGTASMLPREDGGVVDAKLRVYGTSNLRVADLSILPLELSCHTQSVAYAIGEKAADILKAEWI